VEINPEHELLLIGRIIHHHRETTRLAVRHGLTALVIQVADHQDHEAETKNLFFKLLT
jgi:hypothetical protein